MFPFRGYQLDGKLFIYFLLLPSKVYADVINGLQYCVAKMQMKSEMYAKYGHSICFWEKYDYKNRLSIKLHHKWTKNGPYSRHFHWFVRYIFSYDLNIMHAWEAVDLRIYLAQKNHGYSISTQSYYFYIYIAQLDILEFTLSCIALLNLWSTHGS